MTRVALVVEELRATGGQERTVLEIARALGGAYDVTAIAAAAQLDPGREPFRWHRVHRFQRPAALGFVSFVRAARRAVRALGPDLVHGIGPNAPEADVVHLQTINREKYRRLPELVPERGLGRLSFRAYLAAVDRAEARALSRPEALYIAVSRRVGEEARRCHGTPERRIRVIPNGVDLERFRPAAAEERLAARRELDLAGPGPVLGFIGPDHRRKGLDVVLAALARPELASARLVSMGGTPGSIDRYRREAGALGVEARTRFLAHGEDVRRVLWAADAFLFPTRYDPFGMAAAEALAAGLPLVLSREAGVGEWLGAEDAVFLDDARNPVELAARTARMLADPGRARALGAAGRSAARAFAWSEVARRVAEVWDEVLAERALSARASRRRS